MIIEGTVIKFRFKITFVSTNKQNFTCNLNLIKKRNLLMQTEKTARKQFLNQTVEQQQIPAKLMLTLKLVGCTQNTKTNIRQFIRSVSAAGL